MNSKKSSHNENSKVTNRKVSLKNYIILFVIFILTVIVVFGLRNWYVSYQKYQLTVPILKGELKEVTVEALDNYLIENDDAIIYIEVSDDENSRDVAKDLLNVLKKRDLTEKVVYLNLKDVKDKDAFFNSFNSKYMVDGKIDNYPALVLFREGKVFASTYRKSKQYLDIGNIEQIFDEYELEGESNE